MSQRILSVYFTKLPTPEALHECAPLFFKFSPQVSLRPPDTLSINIASTRGYFGSETKIIDTLSDFLAKNKLPAQFVIADDATIGAVLARQKKFHTQIFSPTTALSALQSLPLENLVWLAGDGDNEMVGRLIDLLALLGIKTVGEFTALPEAQVGNRLGAVGIDLHQRACGVLTSVLEPLQPVARYCGAFVFEPTVCQLEAVLFGAKNVLAGLETRMQAASVAAQQMQVTLSTENGEELVVEIALFQPLRKEKALLAILKEKLSHLKVYSPVIKVSIELTLPLRASGGQSQLFDKSVEQQEEMAELLSRISAGVGPEHITVAQLCARHRPECSWEQRTLDTLEDSLAVDGNTARDITPPSLPMTLDRPLLLLNQALPLRTLKRHQRLFLESSTEQFEIQALSGPERLAGDWWDGKEHARDYYRATTTNGKELWIYKALPEETPRFYLHGYFD